MLNKIELTIGVNVYNVQKYLRECLDSVVSQKGDDIEIILVDDGSTDNSGKICDEYAERDSRIRVIHQANVGLGLARNVIIENAKGIWITFVDGDDYIKLETATILRKYFEYKQDVIVFLEESRCIGNDISLLKTECNIDINYYQAHIHDCFLPYRPINTWGKLFNTEFIKTHNLRFRDLRKGQDFIFTIESLFYIKSILLVPEIIYIYRLNNNSVSIKYNPNIISTINMFMETLEEIIETHRFKTNEEIDNLYIKEGFVEIKNLLDLVCYNADCSWGQTKRLMYLKQILNFRWVKKCINNKNHLPMDEQGLVEFCKYGQIGDINSIDKYYIKLRNKRKYWKLNKSLRKIKGISFILDQLKSIIKTINA